MSGAAATRPAFPPAFADLEPLAGWALATERERNRKRREASPHELRAFYDQMEPRIRDVIGSFEGTTLDALGEAEQRLLWLAFSMVEVAFAVEKYDAEGRVPYAIDLDQMVPLHDL